MTPSTNPLKNLRAYLSQYCHFASSEILVPLSLWIASTYVFEAFDSFPYLVITARVKRAGKTRLSECIGFTANMPLAVAGASAASLFRKIEDDKPTLICDEAESLSSESNSLMRTFLNVGYRKGQSIPRAMGQRGVKDWPTYCPKIFVLIGDVYDTLRDRSMIVEMQRGTPSARFSYEFAKQEGLDIADSIRTLLATHAEEILEAYQNQALPFLTDRDEEIWRPLFAMAWVLDRENYQAMRRVAVDMSADKTNPDRYKPNVEAEEQAQLEEYGRRLLSDLSALPASIFSHAGKQQRTNKACPVLTSSVAICELQKIDVAPWRKYKGTGLTPEHMAQLLAPYEVRPRLVKRAGKSFRAYLKSDIDTANKKAGA